jgi:cell division protein FtsZ
MFLLDPSREEGLSAKIKVMGIGGGGSNAVNHMVRKNLKGALTIAANTDLQALEKSLATIKIQLGEKLTKGLGAGGDPVIGRKAMEETRDRVKEVLSNCDMVFLTAGMGGGTGTGGIPVAAEICKEIGALTVGIVTKPFRFEGLPRIMKAEEGLRELKGKVDTLIVIPNDKLLNAVDKHTPIKDAFALADEVLYRAVKGIIDIIVKPGIINVDFADVKSIMREGGDAILGTGEARGENRALEAAKLAISSPLLDGFTVEGAKGILVNILGDDRLTLGEVEDAVSYILEEASKGNREPNLIFGAVIDPSMNGMLRVTVVATGINRRLRITEPLEEEITGGDELHIPAYLRKQKEKPTYLRWLKEEGNGKN